MLENILLVTLPPLCIPFSLWIISTEYIPGIQVSDWLIPSLSGFLFAVSTLVIERALQSQGQDEITCKHGQKTFIFHLVLTYFAPISIYFALYKTDWYNCDHLAELGMGLASSSLLLAFYTNQIPTYTSNASETQFMKLPYSATRIK